VKTVPQLVDRAQLRSVVKRDWGLYGWPLFVAPTAVHASHTIH